LCTDEFTRESRKNHEAATYNERLEELKEFLEKLGVLGRAEIVPLHDPYGPTLSNTSLDAIVASEETEPCACEINKKRIAKGLPPLNVVVIRMVPAEKHVLISTTRIRRREIDREGRLLKPS